MFSCKLDASNISVRLTVWCSEAVVFFYMQPKPKLGDHKLIIVFIVGGIKGSEVCDYSLHGPAHSLKLFGLF